MGIVGILSQAVGLKDLVLGVIDRFKLPPEERAKVEFALQQQEFELKKLELEIEAKLADTASANLRAEAASASWLAKNCRPFFIFNAGLAVVANVWLPLISQFTPRPITALPIPDDFYWLFGAGFLGYVGARSWEKMGKMGKK